ncbi:MAG: hypothetical protein ABUL65_01115, partial [Opitutus sp.]
IQSIVRLAKRDKEGANLLVGGIHCLLVNSAEDGYGFHGASGTDETGQGFWSKAPFLGFASMGNQPKYPGTQVI